MILLSYSIGIILNFIILIGLLWRSDKLRATKFFALFVFFINIWLVTMFLVIGKIIPAEHIIYMARLQNTTTAIAAVFFVYYLYEAFYQGINRFVKLFVNFGVSLSLLAALLSIFSNTIIRDIDFSEPEAIIPNPIYGSLIIFFAISIIYHIGLSLGMLLFGRLNLKNRTHISRINLIVIAVITAAFTGLSTNLILPQITGNVNLAAMGPLSMVIVTVLIAYSIIKYQLFDIRVLFGRLLYYFIIGLIFLFAYYFVYFLDQFLFNNSESVGAIITGPFIAILFALLFIKISDYIRTQVRSRIINPGYDPLEVTDKLSRDIAQLLDIGDIGDVVLDSLKQTIRPAYVSLVIMREGQKHDFVADLKDRGIKLDTSILAALRNYWDKEGRSSLNYRELENHHRGTKGVIRQVYDFMKANKLRLITPLKQTEDNVGMLIMGQKEVDSPYTVQDVEFIQGVASTVGLAVTRSFYYHEVQDLNKNLQKRINIATEELQQKNRALEESLNKIEEIRRQERDMIDVMGHELRTPITIVRNALLVLKSKLDSKEKLTQKELLEYIDKAVEGSRREVNLVETLLSATKVESNRIQLLLTKVDVKDVVMDSIEAHKVYIKDKNIKIKFNAPSRDIFAYADRSRTQEVMDNFLSNAVKYTIKGGITINLIKDANHVSVALADTGIGIAKQDIKHLGKKFFRAKQYLDSTDGKTNGVVRPGGTGLGLYVSFNLIRIMKGKVEIESQLGKGSTFTFKLPVYKRQEDKHIDQSFSE